MGKIGEVQSKKAVCAGACMHQDPRPKHTSCQCTSPTARNQVARSTPNRKPHDDVTVVLKIEPGLPRVKPWSPLQCMLASKQALSPSDLLLIPLCDFTLSAAAIPGPSHANPDYGPRRRPTKLTLKWRVRGSGWARSSASCPMPLPPGALAAPPSVPQV